MEGLKDKNRIQYGTGVLRDILCPMKKIIT